MSGTHDPKGDAGRDSATGPGGGAPRGAPGATTGGVTAPSRPWYRRRGLRAESWLGLLHLQLVVSWGGALPGAAGFAFRRLAWRGRLFGHCGRGVVWGRNVTLWHARRMWIGDGVAVDEGCQLDARGCGPGEFRIGDGALISRGCVVSGKDGRLSIGPRVNIGVGCVMYASTRLEIGADTMLAAQCYVGGGRYRVHGRTDVPMAEQPEPRLVVIEDDCWLGAGAVVVMACASAGAASSAPGPS